MENFCPTPTPPPSLTTLISRVAMVREKYLENEIFFQVRAKSGNFVDGQKISKGLGKSGKLKINSYGRQSSENLFKRVKDVLSRERV